MEGKEEERKMEEEGGVDCGVRRSAGARDRPLAKDGPDAL